MSYSPSPHYVGSNNVTFDDAGPGNIGKVTCHRCKLSVVFHGLDTTRESADFVAFITAHKHTDGSWFTDLCKRA